MVALLQLRESRLEQTQLRKPGRSPIVYIEEAYGLASSSQTSSALSI
jgi:hypothetical protein